MKVFKILVLVSENCNPIGEMSDPLILQIFKSKIFSNLYKETTNNQNIIVIPPDDHVNLFCKSQSEKQLLEFLSNF